jgi:hypothetical protein
MDMVSEDVPVKGTMLKWILRDRHWSYAAFRVEYDKVARTIDQKLIGTCPSRAQHHRWLSGSLTGLPYPDHCRILEKMFPGWTAAQLFEPYSPGAVPPTVDGTNGRTQPGRSGVRSSSPSAYADLEAVFTTRAEFNFNVPAHTLFEQAQDIRAAGLSLNMLFQQYPDRKLLDQINQGARLRCLFLAPNGEAIKAREREEGHTPGHLSTLGQLNLKIVQKVQARLPAEARDRIEIRLYDETIRFNITVIDNDVCIVQPYLPDARGLDSPTFLIRKKPHDTGLYGIFEQVFTSLWERGQPS